MDEQRVELLDPDLEGKAERIDFEESVKLGWRKAGPVRIVIARAKYRTTSQPGPATIVTVALPRETFPRSLAAPSLLAKMLVGTSALRPFAFITATLRCSVADLVRQRSSPGNNSGEAMRRGGVVVAQHLFPDQPSTLKKLRRLQSGAVTHVSP